MIRVAFLDDHPAVRAGLQAIRTTEPDVRLVGSAAGEHELWFYSAYTPAALVVAGALAGTDAIVGKSSAAAIVAKLEPLRSAP
jgi:DNA-binding NarL/FixJ family response regulator